MANRELKTWHEDSTKSKARKDKVGCVFMHYKTRGLYKITGVMFDATNDLWGVIYERVHMGRSRSYGEDPEIVETFFRQNDDFFHSFADGQRRFIEVAP